MSRTHAPRIRSLRSQVDQLTARRAGLRSLRAPSEVWVDHARAEWLDAHTWGHDDFPKFIEVIALLARLVLEDGHRWGEVAEDVQWQDALAILDPNSSTPYHFLTRARGRSKTTDLAAITIVVMLTQAHPGDKLYAVAADKDQGRLLIDAIRGFVYRSPDLAGLLRVDQYKVTGPAGVVLEVLPADPASTYGLRPAFLVVDEIAQWADTPTARGVWEAVSTAMHKVPGARMVVLTTAGDPAHFSFELREHARQAPLWRLHEVPGPPPWADPARLDDERESLTDSSWRRLFLNEWTTSQERLTTREDVTACLRHTEPLKPLPRTNYAIGLDLGLVNDPTVAVVAHLEHNADSDATPATIVVVDRLHVWPASHEHPVPLDDVEAWARDAAQHYNRADIIMDQWQGVGMAQSLRGQRLEVTEIAFTAQVNDHLARTMLSLLRGRRLALPHDNELVEELVNLRIIERTPGLYRIEHDANRHNDRAIALALAAQYLLTTTPRPWMNLY